MAPSRPTVIPVLARFVEFQFGIAFQRCCCLEGSRSRRCCMDKQLKINRGDAFHNFPSLHKNRKQKRSLRSMALSSSSSCDFFNNAWTLHQHAAAVRALYQSLTAPTVANNPHSPSCHSGPHCSTTTSIYHLLHQAGPTAAAARAKAAAAAAAYTSTSPQLHIAAAALHIHNNSLGLLKS